MAIADTRCQDCPCRWGECRSNKQTEIESLRAEVERLRLNVARRDASHAVLMGHIAAMASRGSGDQQRIARDAMRRADQAALSVREMPMWLQGTR